MTEDAPADDPADRYYIGGAGLPEVSPGHQFPFDTARRFQRRALAWIHDETADPPVTALAAPTGGGKTAVIAALAAASELGILCTYPTNALIDAQVDAFRSVAEYDLDVTQVTGQTLSGRGEARTQELMDVARGDSDVVVTNPDVVQAVAQGLYFAPGNHVRTFFSQFDAAVFDEFHYYDPLAASGLLMQIRLLIERGSYLATDGTERLPRFLLTSATPDETFVDAITEDFGIETQVIRSRLISLDIADPAPAHAPVPDVELLYTPAGAQRGLPRRQRELPTTAPDPGTLEQPAPAGVSRFRYPMVVNRWPTHPSDAFDQIAATLTAAHEEWEPGEEPTAAVVFNSAAQSNAFNLYLSESWPELSAVTRKDNGYDTYAAADAPSVGEYAVLNTTSKGEVGLDYDLTRLVVATPHTATGLIQRVGRAGRQSPAIVDLYGLDDPAWPPVQSYGGFLARVLAKFATPSTNRDQLSELAGLRAGRVIQKQFESNTYDEDITTEFEDIPNHQRWTAFLRALSDADDALSAALGSPTLGGNGTRALRGAQAASHGLDSLRGRSVQGTIRYPTAGGSTRTEYDVTRALQHYPIESVASDGTLQLAPGTPRGTLSATYPDAPLGGLDLRTAGYDRERRLTDAYQTAAANADLQGLDLSNDTLEWFFHIMPLRRALVPEQVRAGRYEIHVDTNSGEVSDIDVDRPH